MVKPFLKWAGGKTRLKNEILPHIPEGCTYIEPFLGGGAIALEVLATKKPKNVVLNDINPSVSNAYQHIKHCPYGLLRELKSLTDEFLNHHNQKKLYYVTREWFNYFKKFPEGDPLKQTARFILLNHTCFNGLYRENRQGMFNVPFGAYKKYTIYNEQNIIDISKLLNSTQTIILNKDFEELDAYLGLDSFIYCDPPYRPSIESYSKFTAYNKAGFGDASQKRLAAWLNKVYYRLNGSYIVSNTDSDFMRYVFDFTNSLFYTVETRRYINSVGSKRHKVPELLIVRINKKRSK